MFSVQNGLLTPTLKAKRTELRNHFRQQTDQLYAKIKMWTNRNRERDPVYTENDWTGTYLQCGDDCEGGSPVLSCCCIVHTVSGGREGPLWLVLLFLPLGGATVISKEVKYSPASKIYTKHFMSPAIHLWWQFKKTGSEPPQCLRPVNALSLITESTPARSYKTEQQTEIADIHMPQSADRFLICKPCADIFIKTYLKYWL